jgi:O-antigen ligase
LIVITRDGTGAYFRWAALLTVFLYSAGYALIGFGFLFGGALWLLIRRHRVLWQPSQLDLPMAVFGVVLLVSAGASPYHALAFEVTWMLIISGAVYFGSFSWLLARDPGLPTTLLRTWVWGGVGAALAGLAYGAMHYLEGSPPGTFYHARAQIPRGVGPNGLGTTLLLASMVALSLAAGARGWRRAGWAAAGFVAFAGLLASGSRASLAGWLVAVVYFTCAELRFRPKKLLAVLAGGFVIVALATIATPQFMGRLRYTGSDVSHNRIQIWRESFDMFRAHPLLGTGFGTFEREYARHKDPGMSPEPFAFDLALNLAVETGLLGLLAAGLIAFAAFRFWWSANPPSLSAGPLRPLIGALWLGLLVDQLADNTLFSISTSAGLWVLLAITVASPPAVTDPGPRRAEAPSAVASLVS